MKKIIIYSLLFGLQCTYAQNFENKKLPEINLVKESEKETENDVLFVQEDETQKFSFIGQTRSIADIERSLGNGSNVNTNLYEGNTLITVSGMRNSVDLFKLAFKYNANYRSSNNNGQNLLHLSLRNPNIDYLKTVSSLLNQKQIAELLSKKDKYGATPVHIFYAYYKGNKDVSTWLQSNGGKVNEQDKNGLNPGHYSVYSGNCSNLYFWLNQGGDISQQTKSGRSVEMEIFNKCSAFDYPSYYSFVGNESKEKIKKACKNLERKPVLFEDKNGKIISDNLC